MFKAIPLSIIGTYYSQFWFTILQNDTKLEASQWKGKQLMIIVSSTLESYLPWTHQLMLEVVN